MTINSSTKRLDKELGKYINKLSECTQEWVEI